MPTKYKSLSEEKPEIDHITVTDEATTEENIRKPQEQFPMKELIVMYLITASDSVALTVISPFVPDLCRYRFGISEEYVGVAAGLLIGGFSLAVFLSSFFIGHLSDIYGRKPLLLMGLTSGAVTTFVFGLSPNFGVALGIRLAAGFTNGNNALSKSVIADITTGKNRAIGFAYMGASFSIARAVSSAISGLTTGVIISKSIPMLNDPYILPCLIGGSFNALALIATIFFVPETNKKGKKHGNSGIFAFVPGLKEIARDPLQRKLNVAACLNSFANGALLLALVLLFSLEIEYRGLGFNPLEIGIVYTWFGVVAALFQIFFFKKLVGKLSIIKTYQMGISSLGASTLLLPLGVVFYWVGGKNPTTTVLTWVFIGLLTLPMSVGFMTALPVVNSMQSNSANPERVGLVQGTAQSLNGLVRSMGPVVAGGVFSLSAAFKFPFLLFIMLSVFYAVCYYLTTTISPSDEKRCEGEAAFVELKETVVVPEKEEEGLLEQEVELIQQEEDEFVLSDKNKA